MKIVAIGEILWDLLPKAEHLGGAPFNFTLHAGNLGHQVCFVSAVGNDQRGRHALEHMDEAGLATRFVRCVPDQLTGTVTVNFDSSGGAHYKIHRPAAYDFPALGSEDFAALLTPSPDWIYFGTLQQMSPAAHELTVQLLSAAPAARHFYDVNLRIDSYTPDLVRNLTRHAHVLKLSAEELPAVQEILGIPGTSHERFCRNSASTFDLQAVCVTRGPRGCALLLNGEFLEAPGFCVPVADTIGAGDAFSAVLLHGIDAGWPVWQIADFANRVAALVASRPGGTPKWTVADAMAI
jgi:fructokinase